MVLKRALRRTFPSQYAFLRRTYVGAVKRRRERTAPWNRTSFGARSLPSPLVTELFDRIRTIPGWFNVDDCAHFSLVLSMQRMLGVHGDILEIGTYHGRSSCVLASQLQPGERLVICDAFESPTEDGYHDPPSVATLWANLHAVDPGLSSDEVEIHRCYSTDLRLPAGQRFRFAHVDGGHSKDAALNDLRLCAHHLLPGGVIAVDDYRHPSWPGVSEGVEQFLAETPQFAVLADLNRHGADGRKLYLTLPSSLAPAPPAGPPALDGETSPSSDSADGSSVQASESG